MSALTRLKTVELAPTPKPTIRIAKVASPASRRSVLKLYRISWVKVSRADLILDPLSIEHHHSYSTHCVDVLEWITFDQHQVGKLSFCDRAQAICDAEKTGVL